MKIENSHLNIDCNFCFLFKMKLKKNFFLISKRLALKPLVLLHGDISGSDPSCNLELPGGGFKIQSKKKANQQTKQNENRLTDAENKWVVAGGERVEGGQNK